MNKNMILWIILYLIFLVIFNVFFFVLGGTEHNASVWMSYAFIHLAYMMLILTPMLVRKGKSAAVFGYALYKISASYFFASFVVGIVFILIAPESVTVPLLVQLSLTGIYGIFLIVNMLANERTAEAEEKRQVQINYIKEAASQLKLIKEKVKDKEAKRKVEAVYDALSTSPVKSHPSLETNESRILFLIGELDNTVASGNNENIISMAESIMPEIANRNTRLKNLN